MPRAFMRELRVPGCMSSRAAAPVGPLTPERPGQESAEQRLKLVRPLRETTLVNSV